jgi:hypothetical protein
MDKPSALPVKISTIPHDLRAIPRWVNWRYVKRKKPDGGFVWAKLPVTPDGKAASSTNPATWSTFDEVFDSWIVGDGFDGLGLVLGDDVQGIDIDDCRDPDTGELSDFGRRVLEGVAGYAEVSPSGTGIKIFTRSNLDTSRTKKEVGLELYRDGRYFTVTGHQLNGHEALPNEVQDLSWLIREVFEEPAGLPAGPSDASERALLNLRAPLDGWDIERVMDEVLTHLDPNCGYDEWLRIGAALHHQGEGAEDWLELWDSWSSGGSTYAEGVCEGKWRSFSQQRARGAVTLASLLHKTRDQRQAAAAVERRSAVDELLEAVAAATEPRQLQDEVAPRVVEMRGLSDVDLESLAQAIQARSRTLGLRLPIAVVRGWLRPRTLVAAGDRPEWVAPWVYITEADKFFNTETKQEVTAQGFRALYNREMPISPEGQRERADVWALEQWDMPVVSHKAYMPTAGVTFEMFGLKWVNLYRPESVPAVPAEYSQEDLDAIAVVQGHLETYLASERERELLMSYIAHNVQYPGKKIRWSPYIHGVPGDGKSFFSELVAAAMGGQNVRSLNGSTLESNFTDWASGYALVAIEEMKQHGHNRFDIMNRLKPYITNSQVEIHPKGRPSYTAPNCSNYIIFSNYLDGAPVDEGDRRYMFLSSQLTTEEARRLTEQGYFQRLFDAVHEHAGALRKWLLEYRLHPEFSADGRAPDTEVKRTVVEMSKSDLEVQVEDIIERGADGVCKDVVSSAHLSRALVAAGCEAPSTTRLNTMLTRLGYRFAWRKKWKGEACRVWLAQGSKLTEDQVGDRLSETGDKDFLD